MDRASDSGSEGWGFESLPVYSKEEWLCHSSLLYTGREDFMPMPGRHWLGGGWTTPTP